MQRIMYFVVAAFGLLGLNGCTRTVYVDRVAYVQAPPPPPAPPAAPYSAYGPPAQRFAPPQAPPPVAYSVEQEYYASAPTYYVSPPYTTYSSGVYLGVGPFIPGYVYPYGYGRRRYIGAPHGYYRGGGYHGGYHGGYRGGGHRR